MVEGVRHLVPQSAKEAHSRRGEATKGLEEKRNDGVALAEGISVVGRRGGDVAGVLTRVESPLQKRTRPNQREQESEGQARMRRYGEAAPEYKGQN